MGKQTNNAFIGTGLEQRLRDAGHDALVVAGVITNNSVEATVRMAGNLGFQTWLVADGCFTFGRKDWNGAARRGRGACHVAGQPGRRILHGGHARRCSALPEPSGCCVERPRARRLPSRR
ncbi:isochorismatase family protein [Achromobacter xylosoxidans]